MAGIAASTNERLFTDAQTIMAEMLKLAQMCANYKERVYGLGVVTNDPPVTGYQPALDLDTTDIDKGISLSVEFTDWRTSGRNSNAVMILRNQPAK